MRAMSQPRTYSKIGVAKDVSTPGFRSSSRRKHLQGLCSLLGFLLFCLCALSHVSTGLFTNSAGANNHDSAEAANNVISGIEHWIPDGAGEVFDGLNQKYGPTSRKVGFDRLNYLKSIHCSSYESNLSETNWEPIPKREMYFHSNSSADMQNGRDNAIIVDARKVCHFAHPYRRDVTITIDRAGPFKGSGDYDWTRIFLRDVGQLSRVTWGNTIYIVGGMFSVVSQNGTAFSYPPFHIHHAHLFPYGSDFELAARIKHGPKDVSPDHHDVLIQAHGDSECTKAAGGFDCMLEELPEGLGFRIIDSLRGFKADASINDVRNLTKKDKLLEFYVEHVLFHTKKHQKPVTYVSLGNPPIGAGPATYPIPVDKSSVLMYYKFRNAFFGSSGILRDIMFHTHQIFMDSIWLYKGEAAYGILEDFRNHRNLPIILECHGQDLESTKRMLLQNLSSAAKLVCSSERPQREYHCNSSDQCGHFDRRLSLQCEQNWVHLEENDVLTVVAFNKAVKFPGKSWSESREIWKKQNAWADLYSAFQHTIVRGVYVPVGHENLRSYVPPAYYYYAKAPEIEISEADVSRVYDVFTNGCETNVSFF